MSERTRDDEGVVDADRDRDHDEYKPNPDESGKWVSAVIALLGVWMLLEAFVFEMVASQVWNDILVGALLLVVGGYNYYRRSNAEIGSVAAASIAALVGLWLIVAPFVLGVDAGVAETGNDFAFWNDVIVGLIALVLGAYSAYEARTERREVRRTAG